ncbi:gliding motility-associated C-terminal domain-containing protein [Thermaurantimonas aggregans]|uniref:T9SS type B sorting domain-containing protein n=1 Tax=Thermaurantimonas aggregans TaxID=2173829 RepID=UPI00135B40B2|nr:gliding motility-associated C-terminal domain-containing protein [Thermaurantimonas aggregans]
MMISTLSYERQIPFCLPTTNRLTPYRIVGVNLKDTVRNGEYCGFFYARSDHRNPFRYKNFGIFLKSDSLYQPFGPNVIYTNADLPNLGHVIIINDSASLNQSDEWKKISFKTTITNGEYTMLYLGWFSHPLDNAFSHVIDSTSILAYGKCYTLNYVLVPYGYSALLYIDDVHFFRCSDTVFSVHLPPDTTLCEGESLTITPTVVDSLYALENDTRSYLWNTGDTTPTITVTQPGSYWVRVTIDGEFSAWSDTITVSYISDFTTTALPHPDTICEGLSAQLAVQVPAGVPGITTVWSTGDTAYAITVQEPGTYTAYTFNQCFAHTDTFRLYTRFCWDKEQPFTTLYIPNAFTPNGDGRNDCFEVVGDNLGSYQIQVFSRWGELVYQSDDISQCWDGTHRGRPVPDGVYLYVIRHTDRHGNPMPIRRGEIRLYR